MLTVPMFLKKDAIRLLEASAESLVLAATAAALPRRVPNRDAVVVNAPGIGLTGAAAELAMSACLVQVTGPSALMKAGSRYKTGREILQDFRRLLDSPVPGSSFITAGIDHADDHRGQLGSQTDGFMLLLSCRAAALHSGCGVSDQVLLAAVHRVHAFLEDLAKSDRIRPYLVGLPMLAPLPRPMSVLVEDLVNAVRSAADTADKATALRNAFLVLPEAPAQQPDWIASFDRLAVGPTADDISLLVVTLEHAVPVALRRTSTGAAQVLPVIVAPGNPAALPIAPHHLRRSFTQMVEQWSADIGNANGRLDADRLDLPPHDFVEDLLLLGSPHIEELVGKDSISAHEAWPFIAASLFRQGTPGPYWFLVRICPDLGQLLALVRKAAALARRDESAPVSEFEAGVLALQQNSVARDTRFAAQIVEQRANMERQRNGLAQRVARCEGTDKRLPPALAALVASCGDGSASVGQAIEKLLQAGPGTISGQALAYWTRVLAEAATDYEDRTGLVALLRAGVTQASTAARKALRLVDMAAFGPIGAGR